MKKALSILLVLTMLFGIVALSADALTLAPTTTEYGYQSVTATYFGGQLDYNPLYGKSSLTPAKKDSQGYTEGVTTVNEGDSDKGTLTIDGKISEGEWGAPVAHIDSDYAANNVDIIGNPTTSTNTLYDSPSYENTYYFNNKNAAPTAGLSYDLYLMWDEDYFYVAVSLSDPDGPKQIHTAGEIWDGDAIQMRIDTKGPNSQFDGEAYTCTQESYTNAITLANETCYITPWLGENSSKTNGLDIGEGYKQTLNNFIFSYVTDDGGRTMAYDCSHRHNPTFEEYDFENAEGEIVHYADYVYGGAEITDWNENLEEPCYAVVRWDNYGTAKARDDRAVYEIALPWSLIERGAEGIEVEDFIPEAGKVLGMSAVLFDAGILNTPAGAATDGYTSFLAWGGGICNHQTTVDSQTNAGSNAVVLSDTAYSEVTACAHEWVAATCIAPETCSKCGYKRGYVSGHDNTITDVTLPTSAKDGSITGVCNLCTTVTVTTLPKDDGKLYRSFTEDTTATIADAPGYGGTWATAWHDGGDPKKNLFTLDGKTKNSEDTTTFGYKVLDYAGTGEGYYYSDGTPATIYNKENMCGTYFSTSLTGSCVNSKQICMSSEYYFTSLDMAYATYVNPYTGEKEIDPDTGEYRKVPDYHSAGVYYQFGGPSGVKYDAGLFYNENICFFAIGADQILTNNPSNVAFGSEQEYLDKCHAYLMVDKKNITLNEWHKMSLIYNSDAGVAILFWDGQMVLLAQDAHFALEMNQMTYFIQRRFAAQHYIKNMYASSISWAVSNLKLKTPSAEGSYTLTVDGVETSVQAGETVNLSALAFNEGYRFIGWEGDTSVLTDNVYNASFEMPAQDVTLTSKYVLVGDANGDGKINAQDANFLSQIIVGSVASVVPADINNDDKVNATDSNMLTKMITGTYAPIA